MYEQSSWTMTSQYYTHGRMRQPEQNHQVENYFVPAKNNVDKTGTRQVRALQVAIYRIVDRESPKSETTIHVCRNDTRKQYFAMKGE